MNICCKMQHVYIVCCLHTEEEEDAKDCTKRPRQLHNDGHLEMGRLMDSVWSLDVEVGDRLGVGEDAGGDHEGQHVDCNQENSAHGKC